MRKRLHKTPVIGTCLRTGAEYPFESVSATGPEGFNPDKVRHCIHGRAKSHAGFAWRAADPSQIVSQNPRIEKAAEHYNRGKTYQQVGELMGVGEMTAKIYISHARQLNIVTKREGRGRNV